MADPAEPDPRVTLITLRTLCRAEPGWSGLRARSRHSRRVLNPAKIGDSRSRDYASREPVLESKSHLRLLTPFDWRVLRAARLRALLDSPDAFTSSYAHESGWGEPEWRRRFDDGTWIVAHEDEKVIGLARSVGEPEQPSRHVESIWVAPTHRRRGVFRALLGAVVEIERRMGVTHLLVWVFEDNHDARRAYAAVGFEPTGERQFLPAFGRFERRLRLGIRRLSDSVPTGRPSAHIAAASN
jgi:GNAT superfamily N-acetyltransferase